MKLEDRIAEMRAAALREGREPVPDALQGVTRDRARTVLAAIARGTDDQVDVVFALLDDTRSSWFPAVGDEKTFSHGATIAHIACHVGILQRGKTKMDREGRDYWIKPLRDVGAVEPVTLVSGEFITGHVVPKSPNSAYRLSDSFKAILRASEGEWPAKLAGWIEIDAVRARLELQARLVEASRIAVSSAHADLIHSAVKHYAPCFLKGYEVVFVDEGDGDRISAAQEALLDEAGITLHLGDAMPDVLLWHRNDNKLWVIEAVTSDGEVDIHKVNQLKGLAARSGKSSIGFTTAFNSWKEAAARQGRHKNLASGTYLWIREDPSKQFLVEGFN